jgi:hypothetical protein
VRRGRPDVRAEPVEQRDLVVQRMLDLVAGAALGELRCGQRVALVEQPRLRLGPVRRTVRQRDPNDGKPGGRYPWL